MRHDPPQLRPPRLHVRFQALPYPSSTSQVRLLAVRWNEHHQVPPVWRVPPCCAVEVEAGFVNSPTQRSLALLRDRGCAVAILEHWNSFTNRRQDAFGFIDLWAVLPTGESFYIQTTTQAGIAARRHGRGAPSGEHRQRVRRLPACGEGRRVEEGTGAGCQVWTRTMSCAANPNLPLAVALKYSVA